VDVVANTSKKSAYFFKERRRATARAIIFRRHAMTETMLTTLLTRIEKLSAEKQRLSDANALLRADRDLMSRWNARTTTKRVAA
jgi:hypothetical protein